MSRQAVQSRTAISFSDRNMFADPDYSKPLVLVGTSSQSQEIKKLGAFVSQEVLSSISVVVPDPMTTKVDALLQDNPWPSVVLLDYENDDDKESKQALQKSLYQQGCLIIYVNVQYTSDVALERDTLVPFSDYELCMRPGSDSSYSDQSWQHLQWELTRLIARARLAPAVPGDRQNPVNNAHTLMGDHTFFCSLTFPYITPEAIGPYMAELCKDVDAFEYRVDLLKERDNRFEVLHGMQLLRQYSRQHVARSGALPVEGKVVVDNMPIVYTVRTQNQAGTFPDDRAASIEQMFELLHLGLRGGVEVLDVESAWDADLTETLLSSAEQRYSSQILGSHHVVGSTVSTEGAVQFFRQCSLSGRAHAAKVVLSIDKEESDRQAHEAALIAASLAKQEGAPVIPHIALILGTVGQFSRVINFPFTPVSHDCLPSVAAPGQMTASELLTTRLLTNMLTTKVYTILGHNIDYSVSPQMHGAAFAVTMLPHKYARVDVGSVEEFIKSPLFQSSDFGGSSVTIPHKQAIIPYVDIMSEAASAIGSVNTLIVREEYVSENNGTFKRVVYGDNTDWKGILNPLSRLLGGRVDRNTDWVLILGAGGTARAAAFVARKLGLNILYYNRTPSKADALAESFGGQVLASLEKTGDNSLGCVVQSIQDSSVRAVISTLPASAEFRLPQWLVDEHIPIVFDVNYKPYQTAVLKQAEEAGCNVVRGSEMLWEQGVGQFELWTGRTAPYRVMKEIVLENCQKEK